MSKLLVQIPESLGLTDQQIADLKQKFASQIVDAMKASTDEKAPVAAKVKSEVVHVETMVC